MLVACVRCGMKQETFCKFITPTDERLCVGCYTAEIFGIHSGEIPKNPLQETLAEKSLEISSKIFLDKWERENGYAGREE